MWCSDFTMTSCCTCLLEVLIYSKIAYGGGIQSIIGVTGAHKASADANTTIETSPLFAARSKSAQQKKTN